MDKMAAMKNKEEEKKGKRKEEEKEKEEKGRRKGKKRRETGSGVEPRRKMSILAFLRRFAAFRYAGST